ncbi:hypothetical protein V8C37DRAFT_386633 [Trichoderma ceciliae]
MGIRFKMASRGGTTTINSTGELICRALDTIKQVQNAHAKVQGTSKALDGVMKQLATAERFLALVKDDRGLQTDAVRKQVEAVLALIRESNSILDNLIGFPSKLLQHKLKDGDHKDRQLTDIHDRFDKALQQIALQVSAVTIGLSGSLEEGYSVAFNVLSDTNTKVKQVFGVNLALMDFLQERQMVQHRAADGTIALRPADIEAFNQRPSQTPRDETAPTEFCRASFYGNNITGTLQHVAGNIGVESGYVSSFTGHATIHDNKMGADARIITGDVGGQAAVEMMKNFWK